jgi:RimJ/RimL family protein N-acetyltransferase
VAVAARDLGSIGTFSWLGPGYRGRGIGTEMRAAALHLAFAGLAAREATSEAFADNSASNRVSQALGMSRTAPPGLPAAANQH